MGIPQTINLNNGLNFSVVETIDDMGYSEIAYLVYYRDIANYCTALTPTDLEYNESIEWGEIEGVNLKELEVLSLLSYIESLNEGSVKEYVYEKRQKEGYLDNMGSL